jgi:hypothetical protein
VVDLGEDVLEILGIARNIEHCIETADDPEVHKFEQ